MNVCHQNLEFSGEVGALVVKRMMVGDVLAVSYETCLGEGNRLVFAVSRSSYYTASLHQQAFQVHVPLTIR